MSAAFPSVDSWGIMDAYKDGQHEWQPISRRNRAALRRAMGAIPAADGRSIMMLLAGKSRRLHRPAEIRLESGAVLKVKHTLPASLPVGYHTLREAGMNGETHLIVHPPRCYLPCKKSERGWALQLYSLRSRRSW